MTWKEKWEVNDWRELLETRLIVVGSRGEKQSHLYGYVSTMTNAAQMVQHLEALWHERKVDRYTVPSGIGGKPATIWRATTKIMERL
jgi:hypothetical protein